MKSPLRCEIGFKSLLGYRNTDKDKVTIKLKREMHFDDLTNIIQEFKNLRCKCIYVKICAFKRKSDRKIDSQTYQHRNIYTGR